MPYDAAEFVTDEETISAYLTALIRQGAWGWWRAHGAEWRNSPAIQELRARRTTERLATKGIQSWERRSK